MSGWLRVQGKGGARGADDNTQLLARRENHVAANLSACATGVTAAGRDLVATAADVGGSFTKYEFNVTAAGAAALRWIVVGRLRSIGARPRSAVRRAISGVGVDDCLAGNESRR